MRTKLSLLLVSALLVGSAGGRAYGAVVVDSQAFKGSQAATTFSGSVTISCGRGKGSGTVSASGFLSGSQQINKVTGSPVTVSNGDFVEVDSYSNTCTGVSLGFLTGGSSNVFTPPSLRLNSAQILGSTTVGDFNSPPNTLTVSLDVVFEGTGAITTSKSTTTTKTKGPLTITITSQASSNRAADASGTIKINGVDIDATFSSGTLSSNANATVTITKN
jgi:hypothetical protein